MSRKKPSARAPFSPAASAARHPLARAGVWIALGWVAALSGVAYGLSLLPDHVRNSASAPTRLEWIAPPAWLAGPDWAHILTDLERQIDLHPNSDIYDPIVCEFVGVHLARSPWIERVRRVAKQHDGRVRVEVDFRKPFTFIEFDGRAYLVDVEGVRLPPAIPAESVDSEQWLSIRRPAAPPPPVGERWPGSDVAAGITLVRYIYTAEEQGTAPYRSSLKAVDVGNYNYRERSGDGWLKLITRNPRSYIHWGLPPGEEYGIESTAATKLGALTSLYARYGAFPDAGPIDIRGDDGILIGGGH